MKHNSDRSGRSSAELRKRIDSAYAHGGVVVGDWIRQMMLMEGPEAPGLDEVLWLTEFTGEVYTNAIRYLELLSQDLEANRMNSDSGTNIMIWLMLGGQERSRHYLVELEESSDAIEARLKFLSLDGYASTKAPLSRFQELRHSYVEKIASVRELNER